MQGTQKIAIIFLIVVIVLSLSVVAFHFLNPGFKPIKENTVSGDAPAGQIRLFVEKNNVTGVNK